MTEATENINLLYCFSGIQVWHMDDEFYLVRDFQAEHIVCHTLRTPYIITFYCASGDLVGYIDGTPVSLHAHEALLLLPEQTLTISRLSEDFRCTLFAQSRNIAEEQSIGEEYLMYDNILQNPIMVFDAEEMQAMLSLTETFAYAIQQRDNPHRREILVMLLRVNHMLHAGALHHSKAEKNGSDMRSGSLYMQFSRLLEAHYTRQHHVAFYAERLSITPKYLTTVVTQSSGHGAGWWIDNYLMRDAERYLKTTDMPVQQIAALLGFEDQSAFGKYFKRQRGVSPAAFRKQSKTTNSNIQ